MFEHLIQNVLPSSAQIFKVVGYTVFVLLCTYTVMGAFFVALYLKRKKAETANVDANAPCVLMHNNSIAKYMRVYFTASSNENTPPELSGAEIDNAFGGILPLH